MMKKVIFYLIENQHEADGLGILLHEKLACEKIAEAWQTRTRILASCQNKEQAERIDEYLWRLDADSFVPHNLAGEGMEHGSPVEICWADKRSATKRQLLVNLQETIPDFSVAYQNIIDFVPANANLKSLARERYIAYKSIGFNIKTIPMMCT